MPAYSAYPPTSSIPGMGGPADQAAPQAQSGAEKMTNPFFQALKIIGIGIKTAQSAGNPNAPQMGTAFSSLLQSMSHPSVAQAGQPGQGQPAPMPGPAPQAGPPPAPAAPVVPPAPGPSAGPPAPAAAPPMPQPGAFTGQTPLGQRPGQRMFGAPGAGQRPVSKQPVIL